MVYAWVTVRELMTSLLKFFTAKKDKEEEEAEKIRLEEMSEDEYEALPEEEKMAIDRKRLEEKKRRMKKKETEEQKERELREERLAEERRIEEEK